MEIVVQCVLNCIFNEIRLGQYFWVVMDEKSDMSKTEQASMGLRYVFNGVMMF